MDKEPNKRRANDKSSQGQGGGGFDLPPADLILGKGKTEKKKAEREDPYRPFSSPKQDSPEGPDEPRFPPEFQAPPNQVSSDEQARPSQWPKEPPQKPTPPPPVLPPQFSPGQSFPPVNQAPVPQLNQQQPQNQPEPPRSPFGEPSFSSGNQEEPFPPGQLESTSGNQDSQKAPSFPPRQLEQIPPPSFPQAREDAVTDDEHSSNPLKAGKSFKKFDDRKKEKATKALFGKKAELENEDSNLPQPTFTRVQSRKSHNNLPAQEPPSQLSATNQQAEAEPEPQMSFQMEWSSTSTSASVDSQEVIDTPSDQEEYEKTEEKSLAETNKKPEALFPQQSSTEWQVPEEAKQLPENEKRMESSPEPPSHPTPPPQQPPQQAAPQQQPPQQAAPQQQPPPQQAPPPQQSLPPAPAAREENRSASMPLPKMKSFGQKPKSTPIPLEPLKPPQAIDPRLLAKQSPDPTREEKEEKKIYNPEGREISEPRELTRPDPEKIAGSTSQSEEKNKAIEEKEPSSISNPASEVGQIGSLDGYKFYTEQSAPQKEEVPPASKLEEPPAKPQLKEKPEFEPEPEPEPEFESEPEPEVLKAPPPSKGRSKGDLQQAKAHIRTAESALSNDNYSVAIPLLNKALLLITESGANLTPEALACHQKLGECSYQKGDYDEAAEHYNKCKEIISNIDKVDGETVVLIQQKLAKALEKSKRFSEAKRASQESLDLANDFLDPGHPLVNVGFRMHMALLQKTNAPGSEIEAIEAQISKLERMPAKSISVSDEVSQHVDYLSGSFKLENIEKQRMLNQAKTRMSQGQLPSERKKSALVPVIIGIVLFCLVGGGIGAYFMLGAGNSTNNTSNTTSDTASKEAISKAMEPFVEKTYVSADGIKSITIGKDHNVHYKLGSDTRTLNWKEGDPQKNIVGNLTNLVQNRDTYIFRQTHQGFMDQDGTLLYADSAPDLKIVNEMKHIAELANFYYAKFGKKYPASTSKFEKLGPNIKLVNPLGKGLNPLVRFSQYNKDDGQVILEEYLEKFSSGKPYFQPDTTGKIYPGLIECISLRSYEKDVDADGISFMIRGYGNYGKFITSSKKDVIYTLAQEKGVELKTIDEDELKLPFSNSKVTTVHFMLNE